MLEDTPQKEIPALANDPTHALTSIQTQKNLAVPVVESPEDHEMTIAARTASIEQIPLIDSYCARSKFTNKDVFIKIFRDFKSKPKEVKDCIME